jgi:hypothetical protein
VKEFFKRGLLGFPIGIAIGQVFTIVISLIIGNGHYLMITPEFLNYVGSEIGAVILQTILCGFIGFMFSGSSIIWEKSEWSIAKQTATYFIITSLTMLPIAYLANWMEHSFKGFIEFMLVFVIIFLALWLVQYIFWRKRIEEINSKVKNFSDN